jgi:Spy/CpxP family protein refolding chaperone
MRSHVFVLGLTICALAGSTVTSQKAAGEMSPTPYAGKQTRAIKALSDADIQALRKGEGMGMAKAAELNGYPGPAHVLALAKQLVLTDDQTRRTQAIFDHMNAAARQIGGDLISHEQALDQLFATRGAAADSIAAETASIGELQGRLRLTHLTAHVQMRAVLTAGQIASYQQFRGYGDGPASMEHHHSG